MTRMSEILTMTDEARAKVSRCGRRRSDPESLALWVEVNGEQAGAFTYLMEFRSAVRPPGRRRILHHDDLLLASRPTASRSSRAPSSTSAGGHGDGEPEPAPAGRRTRDGADRPPADLSGDVAQRVIQVLEEQINPAIASHGGQAELVAVEDSIAYLRLSGGCQGCGMASVTLSQGIEVAILDSVPEITEVIDVTDHASGANPYYEAAKK